MLKSRTFKVDDKVWDKVVAMSKSSGLRLETLISVLLSAAVKIAEKDIYELTRKEKNENI